MAYKGMCAEKEPIIEAQGYIYIGSALILQINSLFQIQIKGNWHQIFLGERRRGRKICMYLQKGIEPQSPS